MKMIKYAKFVICCILIFSLIAPSYAAISASDGAMFITKAEFDSALTDFNARLTTFEAGVNSKIDSQVTSYLDKNGIWNGRNQAWLIDISSRKQIVDNRMGWRADGTSLTTNVGVKATKHLEVLIYNEKVAVADKTGLCVLVWGYKAGNDTSKNNNRMHFNCSQAFMSAFYLECGTGTDTFTEIKSNSMDGTADMVEVDTDSLKDVLWCSCIGCGGGNNCTYSLGYGDGTMFTSQFFINVGQDIWARWRVFVDAGGSACIIQTTNSNILSSTESYRPEVVFKTCKIY